jgi:hypothetical protein
VWEFIVHFRGAQGDLDNLGFKGQEEHKEVALFQLSLSLGDARRSCGEVNVGGEWQQLGRESD